MSKHILSVLIGLVVGFIVCATMLGARHLNEELSFSSLWRAANVIAKAALMQDQAETVEKLQESNDSEITDVDSTLSEQPRARIVKKPPPAPLDEASRREIEEVHLQYLSTRPEGYKAEPPARDVKALETAIGHQKLQESSPSN